MAVFDLSFITDGFNAVVEKVDKVVTWFHDLFGSLFAALWDIFKDALCYLIDTLSTVLTAAMGGLASLVPDGTLSTWAGYWSAVDSHVLRVLLTIGIVPAMGIIATAITVRLALQVIPFVRFGS